MNPADILEVEILMDATEDLVTVDIFHINSNEMLEFADAAIENIAQCVEGKVAGQVVKRITYKDDDGDWCTLNSDTMGDALEFAQPLPSGMRKLMLLVVTEMPRTAPSPAVPASVQSSATEPVPEPVPEQLNPWQHMALTELNRWASNVDLRSLVPKLAAAALRVINDAQVPELYPLIEVACAFQDDTLKAESVPEMLPQLIAVVSQVPPQTLPNIFARFKDEAEKAVAECREEQSKEVEVHPTIICDGCDASPLMGTRYQSLTRDNFDLCKNCHDAEERDPKCWKRVKSGIWGSVVASFYGKAPEHHEQEVHQGIACDMCDMVPIVGKRHRCLNKADYDLCSACLELSKAYPDMANLRFEEVTTLAVAGSALNAFKAAEQVHIPEQQQAAAEALSQQAALDVVGSMSDSMMKEVIFNLLMSSNTAVSAQALHEVQAALDEAVKEGEATDEEEKATNDPPIEEQWDVTEDAVVEVVLEVPEIVPPPAPSARVLAATELTLGVEANEDVSARGDVTAEFAHIVAEAGAKQAFRAGRVVVPTGLDAPVPACAKVVVTNDGQVAWPASTALVIIAGDSMGFPQMALGALMPGEAAEIQMDLLLPATEGQESGRSAWALVDAAKGLPLGPLIFFEVARMQ